jgi:hypothetical protein
MFPFKKVFYVSSNYRILQIAIEEHDCVGVLAGIRVLRQHSLRVYTQSSRLENEFLSRMMVIISVSHIQYQLSEHAQRILIDGNNFTIL